MSKIVDIVLSLLFNDRVWFLANHEKLILVFFCLSLTSDHRSYRKHNSWLDASGICKRCRKGGRLGRESLTQTFGLNEEIGKVSREYGAEINIARRQTEASPD